MPLTKLWYLMRWENVLETQALLVYYNLEKNNMHFPETCYSLNVLYHWFITIPTSHIWLVFFHTCQHYQFSRESIYFSLAELISPVKLTIGTQQLNAEVLRWACASQPARCVLLVCLVQFAQQVPERRSMLSNFTLLFYVCI